MKDPDPKITPIQRNIASALASTEAEAGIFGLSKEGFAVAGAWGEAFLEEGDGARYGLARAATSASGPSARWIIQVVQAADFFAQKGEKRIP